MLTATVNDHVTAAARHLTAAADLAEQAGTPASEALAGQILLVRAVLAPIPPLDDTPDRASDAPDTLTGHLHAALTRLDLIEPLDGPADLPLTSWHIAELARLAIITGCP